MNKRKISCIIATAMIVTQLNSLSVLADDKVEVSSSVADVTDANLNENINLVEHSDLNQKVTGKLEVDMNFALPIKYANKSETNIKVTLLKGEETVGEVEIGRDNLQGNINDITYTVQALNGKRKNVSSDDTEVSFYQLTFSNLDFGKYSIKIEGSGYTTALVEDIYITTSSKRVRLGTSDNNILLSDDESEEYSEYYPGVFLAGDVDGSTNITIDDYETLKSEMKKKNNDLVYDLNRDSKVDITDLTYIHKNLNSEVKTAIIMDTDPIINPENVSINLDENKVQVADGQKIENILSNDGIVSLSPKVEEGQEVPEISQENPISIPINLSGNKNLRTAAINEDSQDGTVKMEKVVIKAPSATRPSSGSIVIGNETFNYDEKNVQKSAVRTASGEAMDEIVIDLGKQVAVSEIKINVTGSRSNKNLTEISKVEFLNNVYKELPKPNMNIPVINNFKSSTAVGNESLTIGWTKEVNVTGYEVKVEALNDKGQVESTKYYKTSENTLTITQVDAYKVYRFSVQSLNGKEWASGYKDEQDDYVASKVGDANLETNANDKDGIPDNVNTDYMPRAWNSISGQLESKASDSAENSNYFGADSIVELQVIPESRPEGPEGIVVKGVYKGLKVSWKSHRKAKDYDLYYKKVGDKAWLKANDKYEPKYEDKDLTNDIPDGVANLSPDDKTDSNELIRGTSYEITGLEDEATYEIMMTATNHHGTGDLSRVYLGKTTALTPPSWSQYKAINKGGDHIVEVINKNSSAILSNNDPMSIVDGDFSTTWILRDWDAGVHYGQRAPIVVFDDEYTFDTIRFAGNLENTSNYPLAWQARLRVYDADDTVCNNPILQIEHDQIKVTRKTSKNGANYVEVKLPRPVTAKKVELNIAGERDLSISEMQFYHYDNLQDDVNALFEDDLRLVLNDDVTQEKIDELVERANTIDPISLEYHPDRENILEELKLAEEILNDTKLSSEVIELDSTIINNNPNLGQENAWQSLGIVAKPGEELTFYVGTEEGRAHTTYEVLFTQNYAESGTWRLGTATIGNGKTQVTVPNGSFNMDVEKGGNVYIRPANGFYEGQKISVRVSGGKKIPHLNVNNIITDKNRQEEAKELIREYIRELKVYNSDLPKLYPTEEDKENNVYRYDSKTSILNSTEIESERVMLTLSATEVLNGITKGLNGDEEAEVNRLYDALLGWEQLMEISYSLKGVIESPIDFNNNGTIDDNKSDEESLIDGLTEREYFNTHRAPRSRINVKYQRMFTGAFMYASSHHVGIDSGSGAALVQGVSFKFDENGNVTNPNEGSLYGWGINHEVGHVQDVKGLTQSEVTNNILALITQTFGGTSPSRFENNNAYVKMYEKVTSGSVGATSDLLSKLGMYWQLHLAYEENATHKMLEVNKDTDPNNDSFYAKLYKYNRLKPAATNEDGYDAVEQTFIMRASDAAQKDLRGFFEKWGIIASPNTNTYLNSMNYEEETRAIYYLNDEARRRKLDNSNTETMAKDTTVTASFGLDQDGNKITNKSYLNQKEVPFILSVNKDSDKILGYEIIRKEVTSTGIIERPVGFVERDRKGVDGTTTYVDSIDTLNNRVVEYKAVAYDYDLNKTEETVIGEVKIAHNGSIGESKWTLRTNTVNDEDERDEHSGHGTIQDGVITRVNDNNVDTVFQGFKDGNADPYVIIDMNNTNSLVGLSYTAPKSPEKKFSLRNIFGMNKEKTYKPISDYEVHTSLDGQTWTLASSGVLDTTKTNHTIYFSEDGRSEANQLWANNARYVKLVAKNNTEISIAELDLLTAAGDNIEIGTSDNTQTAENSIGRLKSDYKYADGKVIPAGSIVVTGEYRGNPAFNIPLVLNENGDNFALKANTILLATLPENSEISEVAKGTWIYWIEPENQGIINTDNGEVTNIEGTSIKAELYRYNKLNEAGAPVGQRLVSDTFLFNLPSDLSKLPLIDFNTSKTRAMNNEEVVEINSDLISEAVNNR